MIITEELRDSYYALSPHDEYVIRSPGGKDVWRGSEFSCWQYLHRNCPGSILAALASGYHMIPA